ncbi:chaperone protein dnaJ GFA2, mitochondrial [Selaginella moellendorffii]|uniref:chaperone protein dnaJ GFA2, mitochondrial n=1 Tax=Selaginella moellendorffii TaxID=88036 RepID=UPI000D1C2CE0|nr:chaperone protein dnaJ GFA2, mitochondrial [Selaginella moellendorffii]|eukprot:XP_024536460.1 chaperone protein dnaJ GFA2, mitochondrial [Selaginella moellendorffii]
MVHHRIISGAAGRRAVRAVLSRCGLWEGGNIRSSATQQNIYSHGSRHCYSGFAHSNVGRGAFYTSSARGFHSTAPRNDFYDTLGVSKTASASDIKKAYYALAKKHHPDMNKDDPEADKKFQEIQQAYEVLKDDQKRSIYDQVGHHAYVERADGVPPGPGPGFSSIFEDIFNGPGGGPNMEDILNSMFGGKGPKNTNVNVQISFMEAVNGCTTKVTYRTQVRCEKCKGAGVPSGVKPQTCKSCRGAGRIFMQKGFFSVESSCTACGGSGQFVKEHCKACQGSGTVMGVKEVDVEIPAGIESGMNLKISGEGGSGSRGQRAGDLIVKVEVKPDPVFRREGADVHVDVPITLVQAVLGGTIEVPTLTGSVMLKVKPGTQPGQKQVMRGKGIKVTQRHAYGDQYVHFRVNIPTTVSDRQRQLLEEFAREESNEDENATAEGSF